MKLSLETLCRDLGHQAPALVRAFGIPDHLVAAPIAVRITGSRVMLPFSSPLAQSDIAHTTTLTELATCCSLPCALVLLRL